ncbi:MAG: hypothetical protein GY790_05065 [Bacteroidetes bacterium]|nr:hypothetical protein [Bacteroidota bacterium]
MLNIRTGTTHIKKCMHHRDPGQGTGLGLSISYTLISDHNGSIAVENQENGVRFIIEIPA